MQSNWLLLRGLAREQRHWGRFPQIFSAQLPGVQIHCLDLPGPGTEHRRKSPLSIAGITDDLRGRWLGLREKNPGPWNLLAQSLGGMVAMDWAGRHAADFASLVLVNTSAANLTAPWRRMRLAVLPDIMRALVSRNELLRNRRILKVTALLAVDREPLAIEVGGDPGRLADRPRQCPAAALGRVPVSRSAGDAGAGAGGGVGE